MGPAPSSAFYDFARMGALLALRSAPTILSKLIIYPIAGMEQAIVGMCLDSEIEVLIPPELAFDDAALSFKDKPVPDGSSVKYRIKLVKLRKKEDKEARKKKKATTKQDEAYLSDFSGGLTSYIAVRGVIGRLNRK